MLTMGVIGWIIIGGLAFGMRGLAQGSSPNPAPQNSHSDD